MFGLPVACKMSSYKGCGDEGEQQVAMTFVCGAEDGLFTKETVGAAGYRTYCDVKDGKITGSPSIVVDPRALCALAVFRNGTKEHTFKQVCVESLTLGSSKDPENPPKATLKVIYGWAGDDDLRSVALCLKQQLTIELTPVEGDLFAKASTGKSPKKRPAQEELA